MPSALRSVVDFVDHWSRKAPARTAIRDCELSVSYADLAQRVHGLSRALAQDGLAAGDRIVHIGRNSSDQLILLFACAQLGLRLVMPNWRLTPSELREIIANAQPGRVICSPEFASLTMSEYLGSNAYRCAAGRLADVFPLKPQANTGVTTIPSTIGKAADLLICYTSGSSGRPKGVRITQTNLLAAYEQARQWPGGRWEEGFSALCSLPFFHIAGLRAAFLALAFGGTAVISPASSAEEIRKTISRERINKLSVVPTLLKGLLDAEAEARMHLDTLDTIFYGAAPISPDLMRRARSILTCDLVQIYGATETTGAALALDDADHILSGSRLGACGKALPGVEVRIERPDGTPAQSDEIGELTLKSPTIAAGYWNRPEETARQFTDGWFRTGDLAAMDSDGFVSIHGRSSGVIKTGGEKVSPEEVEQVLGEHPSVADVAVFGQPDAHWGEQVAARVVMRKGHAFDVVALIEHCRSRLAGFKCPKQIMPIDAIPRNASGKIDRPALRDAATNEPDQSEETN